MKFIKSFILGVSFFTTLTLWAGIVNTKHNLSVTNTAGTIKATSETEVCVFCHTPHEAQAVGKPLWNRSMPVSNYTMYDSNYLRRQNYPAVALDLGVSNDTPGALSRQCLSCHDGTVAIGTVSKLRSGNYNATIDMSGTNAGKMPASTPDGTIPLFGTDLSAHHPVAIEYNPNISINFGVGTRTIELVNDPTLLSPIRLFDYGGTKYIECSSCHDPHKENYKFLRVDTEPTNGQNVVKTCTSCHEKIGWTGSVHQTQTASYSDADVMTKYGTNKVGELGCINCHMPHNAGGTPYITRKVQANTCFVGASNSGVSGANCHGTGGAKDIQTVLGKNIVHPVLADTASPKHTDLDVLYGKGNPDPNGGAGLDWSTAGGKHAMCMDCHNPHKAVKGTHTDSVDASGWYPSTVSANTNNVSPALTGVPGVEPIWPSAWTQPVTFTTLESSTKEYQICLKCHSYWGLGYAAKGVNTGGYVSQDPTTQIALTDVAWEMNKNNKSGHPVVIEANNRPGSYAPKAVPAGALLAPWSNNYGGNTMYCSDCHGAENENTGTDPKGPHGSNRAFMLKGPNKYWPLKANGTPYDTNDIGTSGDTGLFCKNCHNLTVPHKQWGWRMQNRNYKCINCHVAIPHGSPISRLIGYNTFPAPYNYNGNSLYISRYIKNTTINSNDIAGTQCGGMMCHGGNSVPGYDVNPMP